MNAQQEQQAYDLSEANYNNLVQMQIEAMNGINAAQQSGDAIQELMWADWLDVIELAQEIKHKRGEI